jgi:hypothetical protein
LVVLPTASRLVRHERALGGDLAGHLGDALGVVADRAEGVHGDDDADRGEQAGAGERDGEQRDDGRAAAEQERRVDGAADEQRRVDGDSRPTEMPARMTVAGPVSELLPISRTGLRSVSVK